MNTSCGKIGDVLLGKTRGSILALLMERPEEEFHVRHIARIIGGAVGPVQKELKLLAGLGVLNRRELGRQVFYRLNPSCPVREELAGLAAKTFGVPAMLRAAIAGLGGRVQIAFVFGSFAQAAQGRESDVDVLVIGGATFAAVVGALGRAQEKLGREINPMVYSPGEFAAKLRRGNHFLRNVMASAKMFLVGDEHELAGVAKERLVAALPDEPR